MMVGYSLSILITLSSCTSTKKTTKKELQNLAITDSIARSQMDILIMDFREEFEVEPDGL